MPTLVTKLDFQLNVDDIIDKKGLGAYGDVQKAIDSECIRQVQPYIPMDTGTLAGAFTKTKIGSGEIIQSTPYARYLYYGELYVDPITMKGAFHDKETGRFWSRPNTQKIPSGRPLKYDTTKHPMAGPRWFDRMFADHKEDILQAAKEQVK